LKLVKNKLQLVKEKAWKKEKFSALSFRSLSSRPVWQFF
jgi:hypothetical protein